MKKFQRLEIHKDRESLLDLLEKMKVVKATDFVYNSELSQRVNEKTSGVGLEDCTYYVFCSTEGNNLFDAQVFVLLKGDVLSVCNITSPQKEHWDLGVTNYNIVLNAFFYDVVVKCIDVQFTGSIFLSGENKSMKDMLSDDTYKALLAWTQTCNKENPILHQDDEDKWMEFIIAMKRNGDKLHSTDLAQWLSEDQKWGTLYSDSIIKIEEVYDYSIKLINTLCQDK